MRYLLALSLVLFSVWLLWSFHFTTLLIALGVVSCLVVVALIRRMRLLDHEAAPFERLPGVLLYLPWLLKEIVKANVDIAIRILRPGLPIRPRVVTVQAGQETELGRTVYANSITLTPGTVSIDVEGKTIRVHALTDEAAEGLLEGEMDRRVTRFEGTA